MASGALVSELCLGRRVLSVQSHVVHGYVGNRAAVFPLQLLGFEVDAINSVQFSCHTGYPHFTGQILQGDELRHLVDGLANCQVLEHDHLLTGYIGAVSFLREVVKLRQRLPRTCRHVCDPVLGDNGKMYVPSELVDVYRDELLPGVAVLTPNQFEAELLAQMTITSLSDAAAACDRLHRLGPRMVVITTLEAPDATEDGKSIAMLLSEAGKRKWLLRLPMIQGGPFTGTGDLTAAMLLAWTHVHSSEAPLALEKSGAVLQAVISETVARTRPRTIDGRFVPPELKIIHCKRTIEEPLVRFRCQLLEPLNVRGVLTDSSSLAVPPLGAVGVTTRLVELSRQSAGATEAILRRAASEMQLGSDGTVLFASDDLEARRIAHAAGLLTAALLPLPHRREKAEGESGDGVEAIASQQVLQDNDYADFASSSLAALLERLRA